MWQDWLGTIVNGLAAIYLAYLLWYNYHRWMIYHRSERRWVMPVNTVALAWCMCWCVIDLGKATGRW